MRYFSILFGLLAIAVQKYAHAEEDTVPCPGDSTGGEFTCAGRNEESGNSYILMQKRVHARKASDTILNISVKEQSGGDWVSVECDAGQTVISGGCFADGNPHVFAYNGPKGSSTWQCGGNGGPKRVWAFCAPNVVGEMKEVSGGDWVDVKCDEGRKVLGCGCETQSPHYFFQVNAPTAADTCTCGGHGGNKRVWAFCASDITPLVQVANGGDTTVARCGASHLKVVGGGCNAKAGPNKLVYSGPEGDDAWKCTGHGGDKTAWAICQVLPSPSPTPVPTPSPTMACETFSSDSCPISRCAASDGKCTDFDWYILSEKTDVRADQKEYKGKTVDPAGCANLCGSNADAFVWAKSGNGCWCTDVTNKFMASDSDAAFYRVGVGIKKNKACRLNEWDTSNNGRDTAVRSYDSSLEMCLWRCRERDDCKGVQYMPYGHECWLWPRYISRVIDQEPKQGYGYNCVSIAERPVCSVTDGSGPSNNYPCQCGLAVCATENSNKEVNCFATTNECKQTPPPTPSPTEAIDAFKLWIKGMTCTSTILAHCTGTATTCASTCRSVGAWHMAVFLAQFVHCFQECSWKFRKNNPSSDIWQLKE